MTNLRHQVAILLSVNREVRPSTEDGGGENVDCVGRDTEIELLHEHATMRRLEREKRAHPGKSRIQEAE